MKERILEFISYKGISKGEFEKACGFSNGYINAMRKGLGAEKVEKVLTIFPELSRIWLMTGEGSMLRIKTYSTPEEAEAANSEEYDRMRREIEQLKDTIERQNRVIDALTGASAKDKSHMAG